MLSVIFGGLLALARLSSSWLLSSLAWGYIWLFRSLPLIVVLIILYNFSYLYDTLSLGIPFTGVTWASYQTINVLGQFSTAVVGLTRCRAPIPRRLFAAAFSASTTGSMKPPPRWGYPPGGARCALFCRRRCAPSCHPASTRSSVWPRERRWCMSPAMPELFYTIQMIHNRTREVIPLLMVGAAWYLAITSVLSAIQYLVERGLARSERRSAVNSARSSRLNQPARQAQPQEAVHAQLS